MSLAVRNMCRVAVLVAILSRCVLDAQPAPTADDVLTPLDVRQVRVGGEIGRRIEVTVRNNLMAINVDKDFLAPFKTKTARDNYIGTGKLIDAAARFAAYTKDEKTLALKRHLVNEIIAAQEADGYLGMLRPDARMWSLWDVHEMSYLILGLVTDYRYFGEKRSLESARKTADYILARWDAMPANWSAQTGVAVHVGVTGLERAITALYCETHDPRYRDFVVQRRALPAWNLPIVMGRRSQIEGHAYAYLARCLAQLEWNRLEPQAALLSQTKRAMHFLTAEDGLTVTGATGQAEIWTNDHDGRNALGETCTTAYQLRVYDALLRMNGDPRYGDLMERTIYNTLFAAQSPDGRRIRYFSPFEGKRVYHPGDTYCCPCNYRRIVSELPSMVYYRTKTGLAVNLYTASSAAFDLGEGTSLTIRQETEYPSSGRIAILPEPSRPAEFSLQLRIPKWCVAPKASVNGEPIREPLPTGSFATIRRVWKAGDRLTLELPMPWRIVAGTRQQSGRAAVLRGPVVFCLNPTGNPAVANLDAADLKYLMIDPASLKEASGGDAVRPGGTACEVKASDQWAAVGCSGNLTLKLTEFPDPNGQCVYFRLPDPSLAVPDEPADGSERTK